MNVSETLVANWILAEAEANDVIDRVPGGYVFHGNTHDYWVEVKALEIKPDGPGTA